MDVTRANFDSFYEEISSLLPEAEYYSIDFEMSGINIDEKEALTDLPHERYLKLKNAADTYKIIQVGLCLFIRADNNEFVAKPYNIYLFPRSEEGESTKITIDTSGAEFLMKHDFDWNKMFYEGITYKTLKQARIRERDLKQFKDLDLLNEQVSMTMKEENYREKILSGIDELDVREESVYQDVSRNTTIEVCRAIMSNPYNVEFEVFHSKKSTYEIHIYKYCDETDRSTFLKPKQLKRDVSFRKEKGFLAVFELLFKYKKPLVAHNAYMDLLFLYSHFIDKLPQKFTEFKEIIHQLFPVIYDTKFIANNSNMKSRFKYTKLEDMLKVCKNKAEKLFCKFEPILTGKDSDYQIDQPSENARFHEAGYDAFITGYVFGRMYIDHYKADKQKMKNTINTMHSLYHLKLDGLDHICSKSIVYVLEASSSRESFDGRRLIEAFSEDSTGIVEFHPIKQEDFTGGMFVLKTGRLGAIKKEQLVLAFFEDISALKKSGYNLCLIDEYTDMRMSAYEDSESSP